MKHVTVTYMKKIIYILLFLTRSIPFGYCLSQQTGTRYYFKNLDIKNGLSQNTVNAILQDRLGFMWFGTKDGLNRYDGLTLRQFKSAHDDPNSIGSNFITALYEDAERHIWVGTDAGLYLYYPEKESFKRFKIPDSHNKEIRHTVSMIGGGKDGRIWIAIESQGLFCYDPRSRKLTNYRLSNVGTVSTNVNCFNIDHNGTMWIGFYGDGLYFSKDNLRSIQPYISSDGNEVFKNDIVSKIINGSYNHLYIGSVKGGLKELNLTSGKARNLLLTDENKESVYVRDIISFSDIELWVGTESGVFIYNLRYGTYAHLKSSAHDDYSLSDNAVYSLYKDKEEGMWIGSYFGGVNYSPKQYTYFEKYYPLSQENGLHGKRVREFCQDSDGTIWVGTEDGGLNNFDPKTGKFRFYSPSKAFTNIHGLCVEGDNLWVGTFSKGLRKINKKSGVIMKTYSKSESPNSLNDNSVFSICKTSAGDLYFATLFGLLVYNRQTDDFTRIKELNGKFVYDIKEDSRGNLWLATYSNGAFRYDANHKKWINYILDEKNKKTIPSNKVLSIFEDSHGQVWLTTQGGGFCRFEPETETFIRYGSHNGFPNDVIYQIAEDNQGLFWITTNNGLVRFNPDTKRIKVFTVSNGLLSNQFNYRSSLKADDGKIYLGSIDGFIAFNPATFSENKYLPPVVITDFLLFNKKVLVGEPKSPIKRSITFSDKIVLSSKQNSFSFRLAALSYQAHEMNRLMYKLEGFDKEWFSVTESPLITYSNISYGKYVLRVKASNSDAFWNEHEAVLNIEILPPFYLTVWAYLLYMFLSISIVIYTILYLKRRVARKHQIQMEKFENEKEKEVYKAKIDFFTNVAHEIRTPLTLIKGPLDSIIQKKSVTQEIEEDLTIMSKNTNRLLNLTNQLLDFRKTESQGFRLNFIENNITDILRDSYLSFSSLARQNGLDFTLHVPEKDLIAHADKEAFIKIISNLLSNAVKYSYSYIHVTLELDETKENEAFIVRVVNDGVIIPDDIKEAIFKPFVRFNENNNQQVTTGTGIGLALSRSLAELHHGSLFMDMVPERNSFSLLLPVKQENVIDLSDIREEDVETGPSADIIEPGRNKPTILVVEDNPDMLSFIVKQFSVHYNLFTAVNGVKALEILDENYVNLVISDVMMPLMDGFELCKTIKSNIAYSHIPIILLTAKTNLQSKIEGMELGADAYIEKPFSVDYLQACAANLILSREKLREAFTKSPFVAFNTIVMTTADEEFLNKINKIIYTNLANSDFNMDEMAEMLNMSRSSFYRKIKGIMDLTPNEYLRLERLKKAAQLLKEGNNLINEVCYMVGFNSPSYFSKCFQKQFGLLPKDFAGESDAFSKKYKNI